VTIHSQSKSVNVYSTLFDDSDDEGAPKVVKAPVASKKTASAPVKTTATETAEPR